MGTYDIQKIPGIMRKKGWSKAAALMDGWFGRASNDNPERGVPDTGTITMAWALGFSRAKDVFGEMTTGRVWVNAAARKEIASSLRAQGKLNGQQGTFGGPMGDVVKLDRTYVQFRAVGSLLDPVDDMYAALGKFTFRIAVAGAITPKSGKHVITVSEVGIYIRDSYDFNGDQSLGRWTDTDFAGGMGFSGTEVTNADFREWRKQNARGGDYLVYSDVRMLRPSPPDTFEV